MLEKIRNTEHVVGTVSADSGKRGRNGRHTYRDYALVLVAIIFSCIVINLFMRRHVDFGYLNLSVYDISLRAKTEATVLVYIFLKRLEQYIVIFAMMRLLKTELIYQGIIIVLGMMFGVLCSVQTYYDGVMGVVLLLLYLLPHYVIYLFLLYVTKRFLSFPDKRKYLRFVAFAAFILLLGVLSEGIISRFFLSKFYQYMVTL